MYVCMYVCMYVYIYIYIYESVYTYVDGTLAGTIRQPFASYFHNLKKKNLKHDFKQYFNIQILNILFTLYISNVSVITLILCALKKTSSLRGSKYRGSSSVPSKLYYRG